MLDSIYLSSSEGLFFLLLLIFILSIIGFVVLATTSEMGGSTDGFLLAAEIFLLVVGIFTGLLSLFLILMHVRWVG